MIHGRLRNRGLRCGVGPSMAVLLVFQLGMMSLTVWEASAEPLDSPLTKLLRIDIPEDRISDWPEEISQFTAMPRDEFERLLHAALNPENGPESVSITSAHYSATLVGNSFREGRATLSVQRIGSEPVRHPLGAFNLALEDLCWPDRPAVWGADAEGQSWVLADASAGVLNASWTAVGRSLPDEIGFELVLPNAVTSVIELKLPRDRLIRATPEARQINVEKDSDWNLWQIQLGGDHRCRLTIVARQDSPVRQSTVLFDHELEATVGEEDLRFQSRFELDIFDAPVSEVVFLVPSSAEVYAVTYGIEMPLSWSRISKTELTVQLPSALLGRSRKICIDGLVANNPGQHTRQSPQITLKNGVFSAGRQLFTMLSPLQLQRARMTGFRQIEGVKLTAQAESFSYKQILPDAQLILDVRRPRASLNVQVTARLEMSEDSWMLTTDFDWTSLSGNVFQTAVNFPPDWEISNVRLISQSESATLAGWDAQPDSEGRTLLTMEFLEAIEPGRAHSVRVFATRRPVPEGQPIAVPLPFPRDCDSATSTLGLVIPRDLSPVVADELRLEQISALEASSVAGDETRQQQMADHHQFWYRSDQPESHGTLRFISKRRSVSAGIQIIVDASLSEYRERFQIHCDLGETPLDRLIVYLTQPGSEIRWSVLMPQRADVVAIRLPVTQHAFWGYPTTGEMWELRLPPFKSAQIKIEGERTSRWSESSKPALIFVPQSSGHSGRIQLRKLESMEILIDTRNLTPQSDVVDTSGQATDAVSPVEMKTWAFGAFDDELILRLDHKIRSLDCAPMASLSVRSLISADVQGFDYYRASIRLENGSVEETLHVRLPLPAQLLEVLVAGELITLSDRGGELTIPELNGVRRDVVELSYRVPSKATFVRGCRQIIIPHIDATVLQFEWEVSLPSNVRLYSEPKGIRLTHRLASSSWTERLFGPLGRADDEKVFHPMALDSWRQLLKPNTIPQVSLDDVKSEWMSSTHRNVYHGLSPIAPDELSMELWQLTQIRLLWWCTTGVSLFVGMMIRMSGWNCRTRLLVYGVAMLCGLVVCGPSPYAEFGGSVISGILLSWLLPRRSLFRISPVSSVMTPVGSTQSYEIGVPTGAAVLFVVAALAISRTVGGLAQESPRVPRQSPESPAANVSNPAKPLFEADSVREALNATGPAEWPRAKVYVLVDQAGLPSTGQPVVYVAPSTIAMLQINAKTTQPTPDWLIESARLRGTVTDRGVVNIQAKFRVHLLNEFGEKRIVFKIAGAVLAGEGACRVNGQARSAEMTPDSQGIVVTCSPSDLGNQPISSQTIALDVELDLKQIVNRTSLGGSFSATLPEVSDTIWTTILPAPTEFMELNGSRGSSLLTPDRREIESHCGAVSQIEVRWSETPPESVPSVMDVSLLQVLDIRSSLAELRFRAKCQPMKGQFDFVEFDLPRGCLIRESDIQADDLLHATVFVASDGATKLRVLFTKPQEKAFTIKGLFSVPTSDSSSSVPLPHFRMAKIPGSRLTMHKNWWWLKTPAEFHLDTQNLDSELVSGITSNDFLNAWGELPPTGGPHVIFQPREGETPQFAISPTIPRRRVIQWTQTGTIGAHHLDWTLEARIEVSQTPVYQHVLLLDRRLEIESISVRENGAERLVRWSKTIQGTSPARVVLLLSDLATGLQELRLKASLPVNQGYIVPLPYVRFEEAAEVVDSAWELFREPDVDVDLLLAPGIPLVESARESSIQDRPLLVTRYHTFDPDPKSSIRVSSRHAPCLSRTAIVLSQQSDRVWRMTGRFWLTPLGQSPRRLGMHFPAKFTDSSRVSVENANGTWQEPVEGWRRLDLALSPDPAEVTVSFEMVIEEPTNGPWELPWPIALQASSDERCLIIVPSELWKPIIGTGLTRDEIPEWADLFFEEHSTPKNATAYRLESAGAALQRQSITTETIDEPAIRLLSHLLWLTSGGGRHGSSQCFLSHVQESIEFNIPQSLRLRGLFLNGRPLAVPLTTQGQIPISFAGEGQESVLLLIWEQLEPQFSLISRVERDLLPWPTQVKVLHSTVTVLPDKSCLVLGLGGPDQTRGMDAAFDRIQILLEHHKLFPVDTQGTETNRTQMDEIRTRLIERLPRQISRSTTISAAQHPPANPIVTPLNGLQRPDPDENPVVNVSPLSLMTNHFVDPPDAWRATITVEEPWISFWLLDRQCLVLAIGLLLSLTASLLLRGLIRLSCLQRLGLRRDLAWLLLGTIWWLVLKASVFGFATVVIVAIHATIQRLRTNFPSDLN